MFRRYLGDKVRYKVNASPVYSRYSFVRLLLFEAFSLLAGIIDGLVVSLGPKRSVILSASHFWPDSVPGVLLKARNREARWIATFYLFPPNPVSCNSPYKGVRRINGVLYYLSQFGAFYLMRRFADMVWVTNEIDRQRLFTMAKIPLSKIVAVRGGVDVPDSSGLYMHPKEFEAVFIGRFHPQKGVLELLDIWKSLTKLRPDKKLAIIGAGELEGEILKKISNLQLGKNVSMLGFLDGAEKASVFQRSKVVFYVSTVELVAMAPLEAMAFGLPCIAYPLPGRELYFRKGTLFIRRDDPDLCAKATLKLLEDPVEYERLSKEARDLAIEWSWATRTRQLLLEVNRLF